MPLYERIEIYGATYYTKDHMLTLYHCTSLITGGNNPSIHHSPDSPTAPRIHQASPAHLNGPLALVLAPNQAKKYIKIQSLLRYATGALNSIASSILLRKALMSCGSHLVHHIWHIRLVNEKQNSRRPPQVTVGGTYWTNRYKSSISNLAG